jgi:hypothetical protein
MAVIERERVTKEQPSERAIFVAEDGRRARRLRRAAFVIAFLACLWVVGLGVGMLGFGSLPGVAVVKQRIDEIAGGSDAQRTDRRDVSSSVRASRSAQARRIAAAERSGLLRSQARARTRPAASRPASRPPTQATVPPSAAQTPVNPAARQRGWARKGSAAPPGQTRKATPPPPPGTRGRGRGQTPPTTPPPVPPGQAKKAEKPLPPPPPPPKKA